jgi:hypothetical protein
MNNQNTIAGTGSALMGAGLVMVQENIVTGLSLIGIGVVLNILVAVLNKNGIPVQGDLG